MAQQQEVVIEGRRGIMLDSSTFVAGRYQPKARDFEALRAADRITRKDAAARFFKSLAAFDAVARRSDFPRAVSQRSNWRGIQEFLYSASAIQRWQDEQRKLVASFK